MNRKLFVLAVLALIGAVLVAGCTEDVQNELESITAECQTSADCDHPDLMCSDGECVPSGGGGADTGSIR